MNDQPKKGPRFKPHVMQREQQIHAALAYPRTSKDISQEIGIDTSLVRMSLKKLRERGVIDLQKVKGVFLWSRHDN